MKSELLVKSVVEDSETQQKNMALTQSKSVSELSQVKSLSDFPIPDNIERLISSRTGTVSVTNKNETPEQQRSVLIHRIQELEQKVGDLETRLHRIERGYDGKAVRFYDGD